MLTAEQLRAARALLRWDQTAAAERSGVSVETVKRLERLEGPLKSAKAGTLDDLEKAFNAAGVIFIPENGEGPGVRLRKVRPQ